MTACVAGAPGAPTPTPTPTPDATPPATAAPTPTTSGDAFTVAGTTVARDASQKLKGTALTIATKVTAPSAVRIVATTTGAVKIKGVKKAIRLTSATARIAAGASATLKLKPKGGRTAARAAFRKLRRAARQGRKVTATITIGLVDAAGNAIDVKRTVKLTE